MSTYRWSLVAVTFSTLLLVADTPAALAETTAYDARITESVKTLLFTDTRLSSLTDVEVKTIERTVYLHGTARSSQDKTRAEQLARYVAGVVNVVNDITLRP